ncbi:multicopper oxidase family protein [Pigmentiphaga aceris]|uniref:Multicopper oxidase family protein n=1 Tax=Pigmentiphaga aceris TaxID=1940612 RepID=A0A5C0B435_9BURK|nr:multicopper oxidase family protein [Pigmentiphaga aceris]QEI08694.1 multicopper oxidase family protein [Pigmentiphaga aceris]
MSTRRRFLTATLGAALWPAMSQAMSLHAGHWTAPAANPHAGHGAKAAPATAHTTAQPVSLAASTRMPAGATLRELPRLHNHATRAGLFQGELVAAPVRMSLIDGESTEVWAFNGSLPGPVIDVHEGDTVEIRFVNRLSQPSTLHWHGLPVPPDQDGNPHEVVAPGESRLYRFTLPVGSAGTYWYHPHPHGHTAEQAFRGLAGAFIVRAAKDPLHALPERHLFISDLRLMSDGTIPPNTADDVMDGREGQFVLVNGQREPSIVVTRTERWRIWNACNARYLDLMLEGTTLTQVGTDGGLFETPQAGLNSLLLAPAERVEIVVSPSTTATNTKLVARPYSRGKMAADAEDVRITLAGVKLAAGTAVALPTALREVPALGMAERVRTVVLSEDMGHGTGNMRFMIDGKTFDMARVDIDTTVGLVEHWDIRNDADMDHPFHLHGVQFQLVSRRQDGVTEHAPFVAWKDTVNVEPGETVRIKVAQHHVGLRMYHCHILEHEEAGMMGQLRVNPRV